jgi:hypothetical protein
MTSCGGHTPEPNPGHGNVVANRGSGGTTAGSAAAAIVPEVGCPSPTCAYHAATAAYFTCLSGGAGTCFHFGGPCAPADGCMFDPQQRSYRTCAKPVEGACAEWSASACAPASRCMFDPDDGLHHHCDDVAGGTCRTFGALCAP